MGAFEVRFRSSRGSLLLASKLRSGKWPSVILLYHKVAELLTSPDWSITVLARRDEVLGLDITSSFPFLVKAVIPSSLGDFFGVQTGDQLVSIKNSDKNFDLPNIRAVLAALKTRPAIVTFRSKGGILFPRLEAPMEPPAIVAVPVQMPPLKLDAGTAVAAAIRTPPLLPSPKMFPQENGPKTPLASARDLEYVKADAEEYDEDFDA